MINKSFAFLAVWQEAPAVEPIAEQVEVASIAEAWQVTVTNSS